MTTHSKTNNLAIVSIILGSLSLPATFFVFLIAGALFGIVSLVTGIFAYIQINKSDNKEKGKGLALVGMILGSISIAILLFSAFMTVLFTLTS